MAEELVIVESPAKAKTISKILGNKYRVLASAGHVRDLPKKKLGVDVKKGFAPQYEVLPEREDLVKELQKAGKKAKLVYLAPDPDREGEAIAWHLANLLQDAGAQVKRIEFNEITKDAVQRAIKNPRDIDQDRVNAQQARRILDRLVGYKISPLLWQKVRRGLSAGRVQSVAVRLICDREREIEGFVPQEYWSLTAELAKAKSVFLAELVKWKGKKPTLDNEGITQSIVDALKGAKYAVSSVQTKDQTRNPLPPFITSTLQQEASRRLGFTVKRTMALAQELYEGVELGSEGPVGLITYMRTDSTRIAKEAQEEAIAYVTDKWGKNYLPKAPRQYKTKKGAQDAHEAIRPSSVVRTPESLKGSLKPDLMKLYRLIWERFLASQMESATLAVTTVEVSASDAVFRTSSSQLKFAGYQVLYQEMAEEGEEEEDKKAKLPELAVGDALTLKALHPKQHFTQPPPRFTEASLVKALEEQNIGRPSTYAPTIATIQDRGYVEKDAKALVPTELGKQVNEQLVAHFPNIVDVGFTAGMENDLDQVEAGERDWKAILGEFYEPFMEVLKAAKEQMKPVAVESGEMCDKCGKPMLIKYGRFGEFLSCAGYPDCKNAKPIIKKVGVKCRAEGCEGDIIQKKSRKGITFYGCSNYPTCTYTSWDQPTDTPCPECSTPMNIKVSKTKGSFLVCPSETCKKIMRAPSKKKAAAQAADE